MPRFLALAIVGMGLVIPASGQDVTKARYDRDSSCGQEAACKGGSFETVLLETTAIAATLATDGSFTLGTTKGASAETLDDDVQVTYGFPYAVTSFAYLSIDGNAVRLDGEDLFGGVSTSSESGILRWTPGNMEKTGLLGGDVFAQFRITKESDTSLVFDLLARNEGSGTVSVAPGLVLDPAMGKWGDGYVNLDGMTTRTLAGSDIPAAFQISERQDVPEGLRAGIAFGGNGPARLDVGNWFDLMGLREASAAIYDLALRMEGEAVELAPGDTTRLSMVFSLEPPDFPAGLFVRADMPQSLTIAGGRLFPQDLRARIELSNNSASATGDIEVSLGAASPVDIATDGQTDPLQPGESRVVFLEGFVPEIYEDTSVEVTLEASDGQFTDGLERTLFVPAAPYSDEGILLSIDSVITSGFPTLGVIFEAKIEETEARIPGLRPSNVFLWENGTRIQDFSLTRDSTRSLEAVDLVFVLDVTGSMRNEIEGVRANLIEFGDSIRVQGIDPRMAMVTFRDELADVFEFTTDITAFQNFVGRQVATGGGDAPENSLAALERAVQLPFREEALRVVIWITDERFHEQDNVTSLSRSEVLDNLLGAGIVVYSVGASNYVTDWYGPFVD
ncbi:MAG: VWA domain-containing protein, partial [Rhodothermales bacterium]|nr:VWA domain-containing protein [Rhodothermales bacterium]